MVRGGRLAELEYLESSLVSEINIRKPRARRFGCGSFDVEAGEFTTDLAPHRLGILNHGSVAFRKANHSHRSISIRSLSLELGVRSHLLHNW